MRSAILTGALLAALAAIPAALAQQATPDTVVGDTVSDPATGTSATVIGILQSDEVTYAVVTDSNTLIYTTVTVGSTVPDTTGNWTVSELHTNPATDQVDSLTVTRTVGTEPDLTVETRQLPVASQISAEMAVAVAAAQAAAQAAQAAADAAILPGPPGGSQTPPDQPAGNTNWIYDVRKGDGGADGRDGYGVEICDPTGITGCITVGYPGSNGSAGEPGPTFTYTVPSTKGDISTISNKRHGIEVGSIGGKGGQGGDSYGALGPYRGGKGGNGGNVTLITDVNTTITTGGNEAHGIFVQSRSGEGGDGGKGYIWSSGGTGGSASSGGTVTVHNYSAVNTLGRHSHAILAQSLGGSSGAAGSSWGLVGTGGDASPGGHGGSVFVYNYAGLYTGGNGSRGIYAQSVGGNGGDGGSAGGLVSLGGSGAAGGNGGSVSVTNSAPITTAGSDADAILAQSVGGGGGAGAGSGGLVSLGGSGGGGGNGGSVTVTSSGALDTTGDRSRGIFAQSVGGGGGNASGSGGAVSLGGSGAGGGSGGSVSVIHSGTISTDGSQADAILAQSIGGGGGAGAGSLGVVSLGGDGSGGGSGGAVSVGNSGLLYTLGNHARGIFAQSVGGGGGIGAGSAGLVSLGGGSSTGSHGGTVTIHNSGGTVTIHNSGGIVTFGTHAYAIFGQSVGGGGGDGASSGGLVSLGGTGAGGGNGGAVSVTNATGNIWTYGSYARGILAQSVGGGGGSGSGSGSGGAVSLGGSGEGGGSGGSVAVDNGGTIATTGRHADAIFAQSVGGGGGSGSGSGGAVSLGGSGAGGGDGGSVSVTNSGVLSTAGDYARGILAQSLGGGGGDGGASGGVVSFGGSSSRSSKGGSVGVANLGAISTDGLAASAIYAQSVGGGGGNGGVSGGVLLTMGGAGGGGGNAGTVTVSNSGNLATTRNDALGILAQSLGGGGGDAAGAAAGSAFVGVAIGGRGGAGGDGGAVTVTSSPYEVEVGGVPLTLTPAITTAGDRARGILAQSVGGGGGSGGFAVQGSAGVLGAAAVTIGGKGGDGGDGGTITINAAAVIQTQGEDADGLVAQSIGGGGGNGGFSVAGALQFSTGAGASLAVSVGGSGGNGGDAGAVTANLAGGILTAGNRAEGLLAQSVGGGGGNGSFSVAGAVSGSGAASGALSIGVGGSGGGGGQAGTVTGHVNGSIRTLGDEAAGAIFQSIGGGGGNGGFNVSGIFSGAGEASLGLAIGVGGSGGGGGDGQRVDVTLAGPVETGDADAGTGAGSTAILVQSVGGGGGNGAFNVSGAVSFAGAGSGAGAIGIGGAGGDGGDGGNVIASLAGYAGTHGDRAGAVLVQSVGGGGGNGALNITGALAGAGTGSGAVALGIGGAGGGGGNAGTVTATLAGDKYTGGDDATAVLAQSVGGGGGNGALNISGSVSAGATGSGGITAGVGGFGGGGGRGGDVALTLAGHVETRGERSGGLLVQSVGGGGGNGALNVSGALSMASSGSGSLSLGVGGFGGSGGNAGSVSLQLEGDISTSGADAHGVVAQSIAGGGGNGALNISGALSFSGSGNSFAAGIGVGGFGGGGGEAGDVTVNISGSVLATGYGTPRLVTVDDIKVDDTTIPNTGYTYLRKDSGSYGVLAQSVGGGGGNGAFNISGGISAGNPTTGKTGSLVLGVGGFGGSGGNAGKVEATVTGAWTTATGEDRPAILAQSLGGSGGNGGFNISGGIVLDGPVVAGVGGFGGNAGTGSDVRVTAHTDIETDGSHSAGIVAQSLGGGGGNGAFNISGSLAVWKQGALPAVTFGIGGFGGSGAISGDVAVDQSGSIATQGEWSHGLLAQSTAGGGGNGSFNIAGSVNIHKSQAASQGTDLAFVAGIGGFAGEGADAGDVSVTSSGTITTLGNFARGVFAQSVGGGGGTGGMNISTALADHGSPIVVGVGGFGGGGGNGGTVTVHRGDSAQAAGTIVTAGAAASAIQASSIGGGGGDAGMNFVVSVAKTNEPGSGSSNTNPWTGRVDDSALYAYSALLAEIVDNAPPASESGPSSQQYSVQLVVGGSGGAAGDGSSVTVNNYSGLFTAGAQSSGILAQSLGGGGGNVNYNLGFGYVPKARSAKITLGGGGGEGGDGDVVTVVHRGDIGTAGNDAYGILAQSIGGGGGNAAVSLKYTAEDLALTGLGLAPTYSTAGSVSLALGRVGGSGGVGGNVSLDAEGSISTFGDRSHGLFAQSIGGGGGNSSASSAGFSTPKDSNGASKEASVSIGLEGGSGSHGGEVFLGAKGSVTTEGQEAHALFAQSVGGGGGTGGTAVAFGLTAPDLAVSLGGAGGSGATGGRVTVDNDALLSTLGDGSSGILAQSLGGSGGLGGMSLSGGLYTKNRTNSVRVSIGGSGGTGADGGVVDVTNRGGIATFGEAAYGIHAESVGGGGGNGGLAISGVLLNFDKKDTNQVSLAIGGSGGTGGTGAAVTVDNSGYIVTAGAKSSGLLARSVGGGGGQGSIAITGSISTGGGGNTLNLSLGGNGGTGGTGGDVTVINRLQAGQEASGLIATAGARAHGIEATSTGGGGGDGGMAISGDIAVHSSSTVRGLAFGLGGQGGSGGAGGTVSVENEGIIQTLGAGAHGILAESVGGGGGNGAMSFAGNLDVAGTGDKGLNAAVAIGGSGGDGNTGGEVTVRNSGLIDTSGPGASGIFAQSVGGGGGNGNLAFAASLDATSKAALGRGTLLSIGLGGFGGDGGDGGKVTVRNSGTIIVRGDGAYGIYAQSVSGGGGTAAISYAGPVSSAIDLGATRLGSKDGSNGSAGQVDVINTGTIVTYGANSRAFYQQGVNGGGGDLRLSLDIRDSAGPAPEAGMMAFMALAAEPGTVSASHVLGSEDGGTNPGSALTGSQTGDIGTTGDHSAAFAAQSIGGGGGSSLVGMTVNAQTSLDLQLTLGATSSALSAGGGIAMSRNGLVVTTGDQSSGVSLQSIGGGGGSLSLEVSQLVDGVAVAGQVAADSSTRVSLGAEGGEGNHGGAVSLAMSGDLYTLGERSPGLMVQSIGAGGGEVRLTGTGSAAVDLGGLQGATGNGGDIAIANSGLIATAGSLSHGVFIQSIGGGGGAVFTDLPASAIDLALAGESIGNGGRIDLTQNGNIVTTGTRAYGAFVQALGGGGGAVDTRFAGSAGGFGHGGAIAMDFRGDVVTNGDYAKAIFAQSNAGVGVGGTVAARVGGNVVASGLDADAVHVESRGAGGGSDLAVTLEGQWAIGGSGQGAGVRFVGGADNVLTNRAALMTMEGLAGMAVVGGGGDERINNYGTLIGNVDLGEGRNAFANASGAHLLSGATLFLGSGNLLNNEGSISPGGLGAVQTTALTGGLAQAAGGTYIADLDFSGTVTDRLSIGGNAQLDGKVALNTLHAEALRPGHYQPVLVYAAEGIGISNLALDAPASAIVGYRLLMPAANTLALDTTVDFAPPGMSGNQNAIANYFNAIQLAGSSAALAPVVRDLFSKPDVTSLARTYETMNPVVYDTTARTLLPALYQYGNSLLGRMRAVQMAEALAPDKTAFAPLMAAFNGIDKDFPGLRTATGGDRDWQGLIQPGTVPSGRQWWAELGESWGTQASGDGFAGFRYSSRSFSFGHEKQLAPGTILGFSIGSQRIRTDLDGEVNRAEISNFSGAVYGLHQWDEPYIAGILSYGRTRYKSQRMTEVAGAPARAASNHDGQNLTAFVEAGANYRQDRWLAQPFVNLGYARIYEEGFTESGAAPLNLTVRSRVGNSLVSEVGVRFARSYEIASGLLIPQVSLSLRHDFGIDNQRVVAAFDGAPDGTFAVNGRNPAAVGKIWGAGLNYVGQKGLNWSVKYQQERHSGYRSQGFIARFSLAF